MELLVFTGWVIHTLISGRNILSWITDGDFWKLGGIAHFLAFCGQPQIPPGARGHVL